MNRQRSLWGTFSLFIFLLGVQNTAIAADFLQTARTLWFDPATAPEVSATLELHGITQADAKFLIQKVVGGIINENEISSTGVGNVAVFPRMIDGKRSGIVVSFKRIGATAVPKMDSVWAELAKSGAGAEWKDHPAQAQITIKSDTSLTGESLAALKRAFKANLTNPDHVGQIQDFGGTTKVGKNGAPYLGSFSLRLNVQEGSLSAPLAQAMGIYQASAKFGAIDHDHWVRSTTGVSVEMLSELRAEFLRRRRGQTTQPVITRYLLGDPENKFAAGTRWTVLRPAIPGVVGVMRADQQGERPLILRPGAVVWHARVHHQNNILGDINPALVNGDLTSLMTSNKWFEALWFNKYLPGAFSRTENLDDIVREKNLDTQNVDQVLAELGRRFPKGWVLKAVKESNTGKFIITDKLNVVKLIKEYRESDFEAFYSKSVIESAGQDEDILTERLQKHACYLGWKVALFLKDPRMVIAQERVNIVKEFRVEAISGRVLGSLSTLDRYAHGWVKSERQLPSTTDAETIARVEAYTQGLLDRLPPELRGTPFAFDVALLKEGSFIVIESNAGPESGYLADYLFSVRALDNLLRDYDKLSSAGKIVATGMGPGEMARHLDTLFREWKLDPTIHWPQAKVHRKWDGKRKHVVDINYERTTMPADFYKPQPSAREGCPVHVARPG